MFTSSENKYENTMMRFKKLFSEAKFYSENQVIAALSLAVLNPLLQPLKFNGPALPLNESIQTGNFQFKALGDASNDGLQSFGLFKSKALKGSENSSELITKIMLSFSDSLLILNLLPDPENAASTLQPQIFTYPINTVVLQNLQYPVSENTDNHDSFPHILFVSNESVEAFAKKLSSEIFESLTPPNNEARKQMHSERHIEYKDHVQDYTDYHTGERPTLLNIRHEQRSGPRNPFEIGRSDLDPFSGISSIGDLNSGGNVVGPNHPIFGPRKPTGNIDPVFGGPQNLPRGAVPPGARFDPIGPFGKIPGGKGPNSSFNPGSPSFGGPGSGSFFGGDPDNDELPPPGGSYYL